MQIRFRFSLAFSCFPARTHIHIYTRTLCHKSHTTRALGQKCSEQRTSPGKEEGGRNTEHTLEAIGVGRRQVLGAYVAGEELSLREDVAKERDVVGHAANHIGVQRGADSAQGLVAVRAIRYQLLAQHTSHCTGQSPIYKFRIIRYYFHFDQLKLFHFDQ